MCTVIIFGADVKSLSHMTWRVLRGEMFNFNLNNDWLRRNPIKGGMPSFSKRSNALESPGHMTRWLSSKYV